ncbi:MOG interacting and ectopic P-granules protein 1-like isoform X2 [Oppia nitens]|uniref:MOG interacting and ectopic P-granules protein 1-like isoform X2 n=1 Tax=Oppia nitens TaxID=1686743 RepID=UPI0023DA207D|nr:MOG interacting and ectopic P-granules protein 1-like isoform X2 [Oppia nitens]
MADNVIDVIDLDGNDDSMVDNDDSIADNEDSLVDNAKVVTNSTLKDETNGSINDNDINDDINQENHESIADDLEDNEEIIEDEDDIIISDEDNSQSTTNSLTKKFANNDLRNEQLKSLDATPNDSMDSTSMTSSTQKSGQKLANDSIAKTSSNELDQNADDIEVLSVNESSDNKSQQLLEMAPEIGDEVTGFPDYLKKVVSIGKRIAINKKTWNNIDVDVNDSILDCPSQVVPLMIQKSNKFPEKLKEPQNESQSTSDISSATVGQNSKNMLTIADFYTSSVGKLLVGLGLSRAKQWYHRDAISKVKKQIRREGEIEELVEELKAQQEYYTECRAANSSYVFSTDKCEHCDFKTEFKLVLRGHMAYPHLTSRREYKCNYCEYMSRDPKQIVLHTQALHDSKCLIEIPPQLYECPVCPYESGVKSKAATHITKCLKFFNAEKLLNLTDVYDFPTITPKPITQEDIKIYEATLQALRFAALNPQTKVPHIPGLPSGLQQQMLALQQQQLGVRSGPGRPPKQMIGMNQKGRPIQPLMVGGHTQLVPIQGRNNSQMMMNKMQMAGANVMKNNNGNKPNILSKNNSSSGMRPNNDVTGKSGTFVICEICDGYIKDLEQLRTHMQWIHKVKIHPKMLASRPPLNCQKCQWRFFTDQGLERHLLGAHGLVTSNMQDMVNQNQDGGRCTICGRVFANKLVAHMNQMHKISLKPAHLSYKCTVCSATFNLYRLFENHVYMVHSGSVKRNAAEDGTAAGQPPKKKTALEITTNNGDKKSPVNHSVVSGNKVVLSSNIINNSQ